MKEIKIENKIIGGDNKTFIIAELSANHNQNFDIAVETIKAMKKAGADAVKIQTYTPDTITLDCRNEFFQIKHDTIWDGRNLYDLYKEAYTPWEWQPKLKKIAEKENLIFFSSPFDRTAVDFLEEMKVPAYKIASFEITDIPLIEYVASKGKPVIISTGISTFEDIKDAIDTCKKVGNDKIALLKCTSSYPAPLDEANLLMIPDMSEKFDCIIGLSDHTLGTTVPVSAVTLGAKIIEKHFILNKKIGGPDSEFSLEPDEFASMVKSVRDAELAFGKINYDLSPKMKKNREFSRSLFAVKDIKKGEIITEENIRSIRPGYGLHPKYFYEIIGKKGKSDISFGTPLSWDLIE